MSMAANQPGAAPGQNEQGHEVFMSADALRHYMNEVEMAKVSKELDAMDRGDRARSDLIKTLKTPIEITPKVLDNLKQSVFGRLRVAAEEGKTELLVMRFPVELCDDKGRAINNADSDWPDSLTGRPRQAYEFWRDHLKPAEYKLKALIIEWPGGLPGDVGFFLDWGKPRE